MNTPLLDHHYIEGEDGSIYVVYGNTHPPGRVYAYLKYRPVGRTTPWCRRGVCYERVVKHYALSEILGPGQRLEHDPVYGVPVPTLRLTGRETIHDPRRRLRGILPRPGDPLESALLEFLEELGWGGPWGSLGVTGSVLVGIHNPAISDIDVVVYGCTASARLIGVLRDTGMLGPLRPEELATWASRVAQMHGGSMEWARSLYRPWRRGVFKGRVFSVIPVDEEAGRYGGEVYRTVGCVEARLMVPPLQCSALYTPSKAYVESSSILRGPPRPRIRLLLSFENLFSPIMYEGGELVVSGELAESMGQGFLLVGTRRCGGAIRRAARTS